MRSGILFPAPFPNDTESRAFMVEFGGIRDSAKFTFSEVSPKGLKVDGFAIKDIWGAGIYATELKGENRDSAEIWFDKVGALWRLSSIIVILGCHLFALLHYMIARGPEVCVAARSVNEENEFRDSDIVHALCGYG